MSDLLSLSRIEDEARREEVSLALQPLKGTLEAAMQALEPAASARDVGITFACKEELVVRQNSTMLEQAVINLIDNAVKYSEPGTTVRIEAERTADGLVQIRVIDQGCGIPAEHLPRLFERFYRVDKARSRKLGGTGLGLAIVKHIAQAHRGQVSVTSEPGKGSTFTLQLPGV